MIIVEVCGCKKMKNLLRKEGDNQKKKIFFFFLVFSFQSFGLQKNKMRRERQPKEGVVYLVPDGSEVN